MADEPKLRQEDKLAQDAWAQALAQERSAAKILLTTASPFLSSDKLDDKLVPCVVLGEATPHGLAEFAQQGKEQESLVRKLLGDTKLMKVCTMKRPFSRTSWIQCLKT